MKNSLNKEIDILNDFDIIEIENVKKKEIKPKKSKKISSNNILEKTENLFIRLNSIMSEIKAIKSELKIICKTYNNQQKPIFIDPNKYISKRNGFLKPKKIPDKLSEYLKLTNDVEMTRNEVIKMIYNKIKVDGLLYSKDKRIFRPNEELIELFNLDKDVVMNVTDPKDKNGFTFFTLQKHIAKLYNENDFDKKVKKDKKKKEKKKKEKKKDKKKINKKLDLKISEENSCSSVSVNNVSNCDRFIDLN